MNISSSKANPEVSVVLPIYNRDAYLRLAIDSILNQTLQNFELIIVNDGSSNAECLKIIRDYESRDERVQVISQENSGLAAARNTGIDAARGAYIAFMDDDDINEPTRLEKQAAVLRESENVNAVTPLQTSINASGRMIGDLGYLRSGFVRNPIIYEADPNIYKSAFSPEPPSTTTIYRLIYKMNLDIRKPVFQTQLWFSPATMFRARAIKRFKLNPLFLIAEDLDFSLRFLEQHATAVIPEHLYRYRAPRQCQNSLSTDPQIIYWALAAFLCALYRRQGKPEPLQRATQVRELVPLFKELPLPSITCCLKGLRNKLKRMLILRQDSWITTIITDLDKAFLDSEHAVYWVRTRRYALRKLRHAALRRGRLLWLMKDYRRLANSD